MLNEINKEQVRPSVTLINRLTNPILTAYQGVKNAAESVATKIRTGSFAADFQNLGADDKAALFAEANRRLATTISVPEISDPSIAREQKIGLFLAQIKAGKGNVDALVNYVRKESAPGEFNNSLEELVRVLATNITKLDPREATSVLAKALTWTFENAEALREEYDRADSYGALNNVSFTNDYSLAAKGSPGIEAALKAL